MKITCLKTEYLTDPIGLMTPNPRFSWSYEGDDPAEQKSCRILVSASHYGESDLWDSGMILTAETVNIEYRGKALGSSGQAFVTVHTTDVQGRTYEATGSFEMGLLEPDGYIDWQGQWLGNNALSDSSTYLIRHEFVLKEKPIKRARIYLASTDYHILYVNGEQVDPRLLAPSQTDVTKRVAYITYNVTDFLHGGTNCLGIRIGQGWSGQKLAIAQIFCEYRDGEIFTHGSGAGPNEWSIKSTPSLHSSIYAGERYDPNLAKEIEGWTKPGFRAKRTDGWSFTNWSISRALKVPDLLEPIGVVATYQPIEKVPISPTVTVYHFPKNIAGRCRILITGETGSRISLRYAEMLKENGEIDQTNLGTSRSTDTYVLQGCGTEDYVPTFTWHGFSYVQAETEGNVTLLAIEAEHIRNTVESVGYFHSSDDDLNALHQMAVQTESNNLLSIMSDCPQRDERMGWLNDMTPRLYQTVNNFNMALFFDKVSKDILDEQLPVRGQIAETAPFKSGGQPADPVCISYLLLGWFSYRYYGNTRLIREHYESYKKWVNFLLEESPGYICNYSNVGDWVSPSLYDEEKVDKLYVSTAYVIWHLKLMAYFAGLLNKEEDRAYFDSQVQKCTGAIISRYYDEETANFDKGSQAANAMALSIGFAPKKDRERILHNLAEDVMKKGYHSTSGNQGYRHLFSALGDAGYADLLVKVLKNPDYPGWGFMLKNGATTVWERWEKDVTTEMHSFNHPMHGSYDLLFYQYLGGITVSDDAYACNKIHIHPSFVPELDFVDCSLQTIRGKIVSSWKRVNEHIEYTLVIPQGAKAKVSLGQQAVLDGASFQDGRILSAGKYCFRI